MKWRAAPAWLDRIRPQFLTELHLGEPAPGGFEVVVGEPGGEVDEEEPVRARLRRDLARLFDGRVDARLMPRRLVDEQPGVAGQSTTCSHGAVSHEYAITRSVSACSIRSPIVGTGWSTGEAVTRHEALVSTSASGSCATSRQSMSGTPSHPLVSNASQILRACASAGAMPKTGIGRRRPVSQSFSMKRGKPLTWSGCSCVTMSPSSVSRSMPAAISRWTRSPPQSMARVEVPSETASIVVVRCGSETAAPVPRRWRVMGEERWE